MPYSEQEQISALSHFMSHPWQPSGTAPPLSHPHPSTPTPTPTESHACRPEAFSLLHPQVPPRPCTRSNSAEAMPQPVGLWWPCSSPVGPIHDRAPADAKGGRGWGPGNVTWPHTYPPPYKMTQSKQNGAYIILFAGPKETDSHHTFCTHFIQRTAARLLQNLPLQGQLSSLLLARGCSE